MPRTKKSTILFKKTSNLKNSILIGTILMVYILQLLHLNCTTLQTRKKEHISQESNHQGFVQCSQKPQLFHPRTLGKKLSANFLARYRHGNQERKRGIKNFHLNIRSLGKKMSEVKYIIKQHSPHILGLSECELRKLNNKYDEKKLHVPGYELLFPASWEALGHARVVMYVRSTLTYQQVHDLQDVAVQSVWIRGGFKNSKPIYFCHLYREHSCALGNSIAIQRQNLVTMLNQWEAASAHTSYDDPEEIHVAGDMNIDTLGGKWLNSNYSLVTLSRLVDSLCKAVNLTQLVSSPTRNQFNRITGNTDISCIDHIYTNARYRCSNVSIFSFGGSDHDLIGYTRYSKDPPQPSKTIRKRTYKDFVVEDFLADLNSVDWREVLQCEDVDEAADHLTGKFRQVLNKHAPWIVFQQRKHYAPWLTDQTLKIMKERDESKADAVKLVQEGRDSTGAWNKYRRLRNTVNNRRKNEEKVYKSEKLKKNLDSPCNTWKVAKEFMEWEGGSGPPNQLTIGGKLVTRATDIATHMNSFFLHKVALIRAGIRHIPNTFSKCYEVMQGKSCRLAMKHGMSQ